jgi:ATP-binding cassette subfamily B protein
MKIMLGRLDNLFGPVAVLLPRAPDHLHRRAGAAAADHADDWRLGLLLIALVAIFAVVSGWGDPQDGGAQGTVEGLQSQLAGNAQDALSNVVVVQSFARMQNEARLFGDIVRQVIAHQFPVLNWWAVVAVLTRSAATITVIAIFVLGTVLHLRGQATVGEIVSFMGFATLLISRMEGAVGFVSRLVFQLPRAARAVRGDGRADHGAGAAGRAHAAPGGRRRRLRERGLRLPRRAAHPGRRVAGGAAGRTVALVGQTGAGKSTAMALLQRLWDPVDGRITLDGHDLRDLTLDSLRRNIGVVFQEAMLFNRTIRDNLLVGRPDASQEDLERACRMAEAHDFISRKPQGYDTLIGERGVMLSGGQRQRLAIARALLKDPPVLILDEATSALDAATEARVQRALRALMQNRTTFIIAHRLSTVRDADEILVFDQGRVAERGSFEELVRQGGLFAELVRTQLTSDPTAEPEAAQAVH